MATLEFQSGPPALFRSRYHHLWRLHKPGYAAFSYLDSHFDRITQGRFLLLRHRFSLESLCLSQSGRPLLLATLFRPSGGWSEAPYPASLGAFAADPGLRSEEAAYFFREVRKRYSNHLLIGPLNGHAYLGFGLPPSGAEAAKIGFQTAAPHRLQEVLFGDLRSREYRKHYSFETILSRELVSRLEAELKDAPGISVRQFRHWNARADFNTMNQLVNRCFVSHFDFAPLSDEENWDVFRFSLPLLRSSHLVFLEDHGKPIGFCLGLRDYNQILRNDSDWMNYVRIGLGSRPRRARLVHIGILPEYQGQGLIKQARHRVLLAFAREGVGLVENSYIDEGNVNSRGNVLSTGAKPLHTFQLLHCNQSD